MEGFRLLFLRIFAAGESRSLDGARTFRCRGDVGLPDDEDDESSDSSTET